MEPIYAQETPPTLENDPAYSRFDLKKRCGEFLSKRKNLPFAELEQLAKDADFILVRQKGSHKIYKHPTYRTDDTPPSDRMNFQNINGKAVSYQVEQLVYFIRTAVKK
jgi:predicted RNA binding protein YcfA (HicA-like mRNA interferase family)